MKIPVMQNQCRFRLEGVSEGRAVLFICNDPENPNIHKIVYQDTCDKCDRSQPGNPISETPSERPQKAHLEPPEITPDGRLIYARTDWEPPPCPPGYRSLSSDQTDDDAWVLVPLEPICKHLELVPSERGPCGYCRVAKRCLLVDSFIGQRTCETCPRKE